MPIIKCKCGKETNTALCFHINNRDDPHRADYCYLAWENNGWVKGCYYDKLSPESKLDWFHKQHADKLLTMNCQICGRFTPDMHQEKHHLIPRSKGGKEKITVCQDCGKQIHLLFTNKELKKDFNTIEKLLASEKVQKWIKWVRKKPDWGVCMKVKK